MYQTVQVTMARQDAEMWLETLPKLARLLDGLGLASEAESLRWLERQMRDGLEEAAIMPGDAH